MGKNYLQHGIPCALHHHVTTTKRKVEKLSTPERQLAFKNWVAYIRTNSSDVPQETRFMCPLRDCDESYTDLEPMLGHVAVCPKLDAAEYMCPHCSKYETYDTTRHANQQGPLRRTGSKLKRAVIFFRHLGLKGCPWTCHHEPFLPKSNGTDKTTSELAKNSASVMSLELDSNPCFELASELELPAGDVFLSKSFLDRGVEAPYGRSTACNAQQSYVFSSYTKHIYGPDDYNHVTTSAWGCNNPAGPSHSASSSPDGWAIDSPLPQGSSQLPSQANKALVGLAELEDPSTEQNLSSAYVGGLQELPADQVPQNATLTAADAGQTRHAVHAGRLQVLAKVEELYHLFEIVHSEWTRRLSLNPELRQNLSHIPVDILFQMGLQALKEVLESKTPKTFETTFALMQVATACAFLKYGEGHMPSWYVLLQECMEWRHAVSDSDERSLFTRSMIRVMDASQHTGSIAPHQQSPSILCHSAHPLSRPVPHQHVAGSRTTSGKATWSSQPHNESSDSESLLRRLNRGWLIAAFKDFLDTIALVEVLGRPPAPSTWWIEQHQTGIYEMNRLIISDLKVNLLLDDIHYEISDIERQILAGRLWNPREVELMLLNCCEKLSTNASLQRACRLTIAQVCDRFMSSARPRWRDDHYMVYASNVCNMTGHGMRCSVRLPTYEASTKAEPDASFSTKNLASPELAAVPFSSSEEDKLFLGKTARNGVFATPPPDYAESMRAPIDLEMETPPVPRNNLPLSPPSSHTSPYPDSDNSLCPLCEQRFTKTNIRRHMRTAHPTRRVEDIPCPVPTCGSTFHSARSDNLKKHMRRKHGEPSLKRRGASKRPKCHS